MANKAEEILNNEYRYGFKDEDVSIFKTNKGLSEEIVKEISAYKKGLVGTSPARPSDCRKTILKKMGCLVLFA